MKLDSTQALRSDFHFPLMKILFVPREMLSWVSNTLVFLLAGLLIGSMGFVPDKLDFAAIGILYLVVLIPAMYEPLCTPAGPDAASLPL
jgi:hypothetical protein